MSFFEELKRRNVIKVGIAYAVGAWLLLQLTDVLIDLLGLPEIAGKFVVLLLVVGFPLALFFAWAFEMTPEGIKREHEVDRSKSITHVTSQKLNTTIIAILSVALAFFIFDKFASEPGSEAEPETTEVSGSSETLAIDKSIAVMPFVNMSADEENEYFSDGLSEELLNLLAKVDGLKVAARTSSFKFKNSEADITEIGGKLNVATVLEGSVRRSGNQARITAQLIKVDDGFHLWSETYDRDLSNIFQVQDEIARAIVDALKLPLLGQGEAIAATATANFEAYDLYLLAQHHIRQVNETSFEKAVDYLISAVASDPDYAPAWSALSRAYMGLSDYGSMAFDESVDLAQKALDNAKQLAPKAEETLFAEAILLGYQGEILAAQGLLKDVLAINSNHVDAIVNLAGIMGPLEMVESLALAEKAFELDPLSEDVRSRIILETAFNGRYDEAINLVQGMILDDPENPGMFEALGHVYRMQGQHHLAIPKFEMVWKLRDGDVWPAFMIANSYLLLGDVASAESWHVKAKSRGADSRWNTQIGQNLNYHQQRWETLALSFEENLRKDQLDPADRLRYGNVLLRQGKKKEAEQLYRSVLELYEDEEFIELAQHAGAVSVLLNVLDQGEERDRLLAMLKAYQEKVLELRPWANDPYFIEAAIASIENDEDRAIAALNNAVNRGAVYRRGLENAVLHQKWQESPDFRAVLAQMSAVNKTQLDELAARGDAP